VVALLVAGAVVGCDAEERPGAEPTVGVAADRSTPSSAVPSDPSPSEPAAVGTFVFACADSEPFSARFDADSAYVDLGTQAFSLPHVPGGSGARYTDGPRELWTSGGEAMFTTPDVALRGCVVTPADDPWARADLLGVDFRGLGQEPGWIVDIDVERWMLYLGDYGTVRLATTAPVPRSADDGVVTFEAAAEGHRLLVRIEPTPCNDVMSGQPFSHTVRVEIDGRVLQGCGRFVGDRTGFAVRRP